MPFILARPLHNKRVPSFCWMNGMRKKSQVTKTFIAGGEEPGATWHPFPFREIC